MSKTVTVEFKCDSKFCTANVNPTSDYWEPVVAKQTEHSLVFFAWSDEAANSKDALHFHHNDCAQSYLAEWLEKQRNPVEVEAGVPDEDSAQAL